MLAPRGMDGWSATDEQRLLVIHPVDVPLTCGSRGLAWARWITKAEASAVVLLGVRAISQLTDFCEAELTECMLLHQQRTRAVINTGHGIRQPHLPWLCQAARQALAWAFMSLS